MSDALTLVQNVYAAFGRGDLPALLGMLSDDVEWRFVGDRGAPYTGIVRGRAQVGEWFGAVLSVHDIQGFEPTQFLAGADHVTVVDWERTIAKPGGGMFETPWVHIWQAKDGQLTHFLGIFDTEAAATARNRG